MAAPFFGAAILLEEHERVPKDTRGVDVVRRRVPKALFEGRLRPPRDPAIKISVGG